MLVSQPNNVKIYNLSAGKSLPDWISERKKRALQKKDIDVRRRIELLQDFEMPTASSRIKISEDRQFIFAAGVYKPRVRCFEASQLAMKFERCLTSEVVQFQILSEDYKKLAFLCSDRYLEFHAQFGRYYRTRIPCFGRDMTYHCPSCDLYMVGASSEIYRLNLEQGRFLTSLQSNSREINVCDLNPVHQLLAVGTEEGHVECWDPRSRTRVGLLDIALTAKDHNFNSIPSLTALKFRGGLGLGVGTNTGQILLYDLRADKPLLLKDHYYGLPIKNISFHEPEDFVLSADTKILKIWERETGKPFTAIEPTADINDVCVYPDSGLLFMATESPKMQIYFVPSLGPAPKWCSFLDNLTEELEEDQQPIVYDDYKFVTKQELESLGLNHLLGTNLLRAYMHGFFMDIRLYHKAKAIAEPFAYEEYRKQKIKEKIEEERSNRVKLKKLPKVNRNLAEKLLENQTDNAKRKNRVENKEVDVKNPLGDERFVAMFSNPDFQVDEESEAYMLLHPVLSKHERQKQKKEKKKQERKEILEQFSQVQDEESQSEEESSDDDDLTWKEELKEQKRKRREKRSKEEAVNNKPRLFELKPGEDFQMPSCSGENREKKNRVSLEERMNRESNDGVLKASGSSLGGKELTFTLKKSEKDNQRKQEMLEHRKERRKLRRSASSILPRPRRGPVYWRGRQVK